MTTSQQWHNMNIVPPQLNSVDSAETHFKMGNMLLQKQGRLEDAIERYKQSIALKPNFVEAYSNLGNALQMLGRLEDAIESYKQAIVLKPDFAEAYNNLGNTLKELGRLGDAIESYMQALKINSDYTVAYHNIGSVLKGIEFTKPIPDLIELIYKLLEKENFVRPEDISITAISLLKFDPTIKGAIEKISVGKLSGSLQEIIVDLSNVPLLIKLMEVSPFPDLEFEVVFKNIRSAILLSISKIKNNSEILIFQIALSLQCFLNEYLYNQTDVEVEALKELENLVEKKLTNGQQPSSTELACIASYKPLYEYSWCHLLSMPVELEALHRRQILEPEKEKQLRSTIPMLQEIKDRVSYKVREQYEQDPYPRWVNLELRFAPKLISEIIKELNLKISNLGINEIDTPQILIAGCGTGKHSVTTASLFKNCDVLAIDLSLSSLAYAKRKTEELSISNIDYMQADILDLESLNRKFDIIESSGTLHHMDDPMVGWKVLTNCLKTGGFMRIGLYSELARKEVVQVQDEIEQSNIESSHAAMKSFRNKIVSSEEEHYKYITRCTDFYTMSSLRDLLFHVQDNPTSLFTIPKIEARLTQLGLVFCGFENLQIVQKFKSRNLVGNDLYDLEKWDTFEKENPKAFTGMYQFWCQKV